MKNRNIKTSWQKLNIIHYSILCSILVMILGIVGKSILLTSSGLVIGIQMWIILKSTKDR
jgi:hypothetical protein